jgi:hypothetical protein
LHTIEKNEKNVEQNGYLYKPDITEYGVISWTKEKKSLKGKRPSICCL